MFDAAAAEIEAIAAIEIADTPRSILKNNFRMNAAYIVVVNGNFTVIGTTDAEGLGKLEVAPAIWDRCTQFEGKNRERSIALHNSRLALSHHQGVLGVRTSVGMYAVSLPSLFTETSD